MSQMAPHAKDGVWEKKNQIINHNYVESKLMSINTVDTSIQKLNCLIFQTCW
jgi:hypothetical protein